MNIEEDLTSLKEIVAIRKERCHGFIESDSCLISTKRLENLLTAYEKEKETSHYIQSQLDIANAKLVEEKEKNKEMSEQNKDMKALFNIQASIAKELDFNTNEKMVRFKDEYFVPDTMVVKANIGEPKTIELRYISATKYLTKFD